MASGPTLAKKLSDQSMLGVSGSYGVSADCVPTGDSGWKVSRIAELRQWLGGGNPRRDEKRREHLLYSLETQERFRLDSLQSVSPVNRARMFAEGEFDRSQRIQRMHWERELSELTGGIL